MSAEDAVKATLSALGLAQIDFEKLTYSRSQSKYVLYLRSQKRISRKKAEAAKDKICENLKLPFQAEVVLQLPAEDLERDDEAFAVVLKEIMLAEEPAMIPFLKLSLIHI